MHKKIALIGGLSPESTVSYYQRITRAYVAQFGDYGYPEILIYSVNLAQFHAWRADGQWGVIAKQLIGIAETLRAAGAELGLIATNTMHKVFTEVQAGTRLPLLHIVEPTIDAIQRLGLSTVGLLGTRFTMSEEFYKNRLLANGIFPLVPHKRDQERVQDIIAKELVRGLITQPSQQFFLSLIDGLVERGAQGIILGCTEIPLLVQQQHCSVPVFDTAILHADAILKAALAGSDEILTRQNRA